MTILSPIHLLRLSVLLCFSAIIVVFFPHISPLGATQLYLGIITSLTALIGLIWNPIIGSLSDTYGRKLILLIFMAIRATSYLLLMSNSLVVIFISRMLGALAAPLLPILGATATEVLKKEDQSSYYSSLPGLMAIGFILGSLTSGFLSEFDNGYHLCYLIMVALNLLNLGMITSLQATKKEKKDKTKSLPILELILKEFKKVFVKLTNVNWGEYSDIFSVKFCIELGCALYYRSLGLSYLSFQVKGKSLGYVFTFMKLSTIAANIVLVRLKNTIYSNDKLGRQRLFHAAVLFVVTSITFSFSNTVLLFSLGLVPMSIARTIADSTFTEALMAKASAKDKGGVSGAFESITSLCGLITPIGAGILTDWYGPKFILQMSLAPMVAGLFLTNSQR